jgi:hypothetical protein
MFLLYLHVKASGGSCKNRAVMYEFSKPHFLSTFESTSYLTWCYWLLSGEGTLGVPCA